MPKIETFKLRVETSEFEEDERLVTGYAYVTEVNGQQVIDHSGDIISTEDMRKAAHDFISSDLTGGVMHKGQAGQIVDSFFFTDRINEMFQKKDGKVGWAITYRVDDDEVWELVKSKKLTAFSIGGRSEVEAV